MCIVVSANHDTNTLFSNTLGKNGVLICRNTPPNHPFPIARNSKLPSKQHHLVSAVHFPAPVVKDVVNVTGAGDRLVLELESLLSNSHSSVASPL